MMTKTYAKIVIINRITKPLTDKTKLTSMKAIVTNIKYDTDGEVIDLPTTLEINIPSYIEEDYVDDFISDEISNITGYCHFGFEMKII